LALGFVIAFMELVATEGRTYQLISGLRNAATFDNQV
jgi:hypothetical protein